MPQALARTWYLHLDPELRIIHSERSCPDAKVAVKYSYITSVTLATIDDARKLDQLGKACDRCKRREAVKRKSKGYVSPPGFRT